MKEILYRWGIIVFMLLGLALVIIQHILNMNIIQTTLILCIGWGVFMIRANMIKD